jgi:hypothetical protein
LSVSEKRALSPWAITAICVGGVVLLLGVGAVAAGLLVAKKFAYVRAQGRETPSEPATASNLRWTKSEPGLSYANDRIASVPWSIHVLRFERSRQDLTFFSAHARNKVLGVSLIADQARAVPREIGRAIAGVNGDFYVRDNPTYCRRSARPANRQWRTHQRTGHRLRLVRAEWRSAP